MRSRVLVFLGLISAMIAIPVGCMEPEWQVSPNPPSNATGSGTGGAAGAGGAGGAGGGLVFKGPQECIDYCLTYWAVCAPLTVQACIDIYCDQGSKDAGPKCQDEFKAVFGCIASWAAMNPPDVVCDNGSEVGCLTMTSQARHDCVEQYGCDTGWCHDKPAPNGGVGCFCDTTCKGQLFNSLCWMEGTKQVCECTAANVVVGMCEELQVQACDYPRPYERCCNQYFMLW